ncbi:hypothetical protein D3C84_1130720 [compost metagenome]
MLLAGTEIKVQQVQLAILQQQGGIADGIVGQGVDPVVLILVSEAHRYRQPLFQCLGKTGRNDDVGDFERGSSAGRG